MKIENRIIKELFVCLEKETSFFPTRKAIEIVDELRLRGVRLKTNPVFDVARKRYNLREGK